MTPDPNVAQCDKPRCRGAPTNTYKDAHSNTLQLCDKHYWEAVTGKTTTDITLPPGFDTTGGAPGPEPGQTTGDPDFTGGAKR